MQWKVQDIFIRVWYVLVAAIAIILIIAGSIAALAAFLITNYIELRITGKEAPTLEQKEEMK